MAGDADAAGGFLGDAEALLVGGHASKAGPGFPREPRHNNF